MYVLSLLYVHSSFAIILMEKRELVALLGLPSLCLVMVVWLFLAVSWICLQFMTLVFPDHTHLLFLIVGICIYISHLELLRARGAVSKKGKMSIT